MAAHGHCILALSSQNEVYNQGPGSKHNFYINGGLTQNEWNGWRNHPPFNVFAEYSPEDQGSPPLILRNLAKYPGDLDEKIEDVQW